MDMNEICIITKQMLETGDEHIRRIETEIEAEMGEMVDELFAQYPRSENLGF